MNDFNSLTWTECPYWSESFYYQVTKEELTSKEELDGFRKHVTSLAALDFLVCLKSDVFVMTHGGNFAKLIIGARRYMGHRLKSIKPDKGLMSKSFGDPYMGWATFVEDVVVTHQTRTGLPEATFPNYDLWENPLTPCMCKAWPEIYYKYVWQQLNPMQPSAWRKHLKYEDVPCCDDLFLSC